MPRQTAAPLAGAKRLKCQGKWQPEGLNILGVAPCALASAAAIRSAPSMAATALDLEAKWQERSD